MTIYKRGEKWFFFTSPDTCNAFFLMINYSTYWSFTDDDEILLILQSAQAHHPMTNDKGCASLNESIFGINWKVPECNDFFFRYIVDERWLNGDSDAKDFEENDDKVGKSFFVALSSWKVLSSCGKVSNLIKTFLENTFDILLNQLIFYRKIFTKFHFRGLSIILR
jgi:hypothetical protein